MTGPRDRGRSGISVLRVPTWYGDVTTLRGDGMVRTHIQLSEDEVEAVRRLARERSVSMAAVIREAVDQYIRRESGA